MTDEPICNCWVSPTQVCAICTDTVCSFCGEAADWAGDVVLVPFDDESDRLVHNDCGYALAAEIRNEQPVRQ